MRQASSIGRSFSDGIGTELAIFDLMRSLDSDRSPRIKSEGMLRWKTLQIVSRRASGPAVRSASVHRLFGL